MSSDLPSRAWVSFFILLTFLVIQTLQASDDRVEWTLDEQYSGAHPEAFQKLRHEVPILIRQTQIDAAVRLGMFYQDGWRYPLTIRFVDGSPRGIENALAYVMFYTDGTHFKQTLNVNLAAYETERFNFEGVFSHELIHAMINDAIGAASVQTFPVWLHEGLAVFGSNQGEKMLKSYVYQHSGFAYQTIINGLEGPHRGLDYAEDYLAMKYMFKSHGQNSLHIFVREVIESKGNIPQSIQKCCFESWEEFQKNAKEFSKKEIEDIGPPRRGDYEKPY